MQYPSSEEVRSYPSEFEVAHSEARHKGFTGSLVLRSDDGSGVIAYLNGLPVYAYARYDELSKGDVSDGEAVEILSRRRGTVDRHPSDSESVRMFLTYMKYLGRDEQIIHVYEKKPVKIAERTFLVTGDDGLTKVEVPAGARVGYAMSEEEVSRYFEDESADGYAVSNDAVLRFGNGHETGREEMKDDGEPLLARMESEEGLTEIDCEFEHVFPELGASSHKIDVEFDIQGWEVVRTDMDDEEDSGGLLRGLLG
ncbi:MAG: hypothetical protein U5J64_02610 [Halobacteriales archaeon]|nr:hypothetical protein [Halobacteriales archaeon]